MSTTPTTFVLGGHALPSAIAVLRALGFEVDVPQRGTLTLLDTFDGRFHRAGLRLVLEDVDGLELSLAGDDTVTARLPVTSRPSLPRGSPGRSPSVEDRRPDRCAGPAPAGPPDGHEDSSILRDGAGRVVVAAQILEGVSPGGDTGADPVATLEIHEVVGSAKQAHRTGRGDALAELDLVPFDGDTLTLVALATGVDLNGFVSSPTVPLETSMPAVEGFRAVLANLADAVDANWLGTYEHLDPEFLHELRVAMRRTRVVLSQGKYVLPPDFVADARDRFAWLARLTGPARDLDVYLIEWDTYVGPLGAEAIAALEPVRTLLEQRRDAAHQALDQGMASARSTGLMTTWHEWLGEMDHHEPHGRDAHRPLGRVVSRRIIRAHETLVERARLIRPDTPARQVHDLRKDAKKLRYLLECFGGLLPEDPRKAFVRRLKGFQDNLGANQDAEVHVELIREIADELHSRGATADTLLALGQLAERLEQIRVAARAEFDEHFASFDTKATRANLTAMLRGLDR
jgi:CHAD domain-containing protein